MTRTSPKKEEVCEYCENVNCPVHGLRPLNQAPEEEIRTGGSEFHIFTPAPESKEWIAEFREYFDKTLKPKKPTMVNLDREIMVDFIQKLISKARSEALDAYKQSLCEKIEHQAHFSKLAGSKYDGYIYYKDIINLIRQKEK